MPHDHQKKVAKFYWATPELVQLSIDTALAAKKDWEAVPINDKIQMFLKVADQMADQYRADLNATTMLGQAKTIIQAEIDSACELIDFFRFLTWPSSKYCFHSSPQVQLLLCKRVARLPADQ